MRDDFDQFGIHDCQRCKGQFYEFDFHLAAGYCRDCYAVVHETGEDDWEEYNGKDKVLGLGHCEKPDCYGLSTYCCCEKCQAYQKYIENETV